MDTMVWIFLPLFVAAGSALLAFYVMQARLDVAVAREREMLAEAKAVIKSQERLMDEKVRAAEEASMRRAMDQFLGDIRVEERHYTRERKSLFSRKKSLVLQERLYFRNIPLSNWVEHEMVVDDATTGSLRKLAERCSIFSQRQLEQAEHTQNTRLLHDAAVSGDSG